MVCVASIQLQMAAEHAYCRYDNQGRRCIHLRTYVFLEKLCTKLKRYILGVSRVDDGVRMRNIPACAAWAQAAARGGGAAGAVWLMSVP